MQLGLGHPRRAEERETATARAALLAALPELRARTRVGGAAMTIATLRAWQALRAGGPDATRGR